MAATTENTTTSKKKKYNPYDDVKAITEYKGKYADAKSTGGDYMQWQKKAAENYVNLINNGEQDLADRLTASDYTAALDILKEYQPTTVYDDYYSQVTGDLIEESKTPKLSESSQKLFDSYFSSDNLLNGTITRDANGNVISGLSTDYYNTGKGQLDYLNDFDVTSQPYYQGIMDKYQLFGNNAAQGELAGGASSNSGNIDSYAQANANRQQLAFTTAGIEAALAAANQNQANWQNVYNQMGAYLGTMGDQNNTKLGIAANMYNTDSAERQNALNTSAALAQQEMQNKINKYLADIGYDTSVYQADSAERQNTTNANATLSAAQIQANADLQNAYQDYLAKIYGYDTDKAIADAQLKSAENQWLAEQQIANGYNPFTGTTSNNNISNRNVSGQDVYRFVSEMSRLIGEDDSLKSYNDVYEAAIEQFPNYDPEKILEYVKQVKALSGSITGNYRNNANDALTSILQGNQ